MLKINGPGSGHKKMTESMPEIEGNARKWLENDGIAAMTPDQAPKP